MQSTGPVPGTESTLSNMLNLKYVDFEVIFDNLIWNIKH